MTTTKIEELYEEVTNTFRGVTAGVFGDEPEEEELFLDGGKDLDSAFLYAVTFEDGNFITSIKDAEEMEEVKTGKHKTVKGVINFIKKWDRENAY